MSKRYLVVRASGGLSNRLQAVLGGIAYCLLTGRSLCVDWRDGLYSDDFSNVFPRWFTLSHVETASCQEVEAAHNAGAALSPPFWEEYLCEAIAVEYLFTGDNHMSLEGRAASCYDITAPKALEQDNEAAPIIIYWGWNLQAVKALIPALQEKYSYLKNMPSADIPAFLLRKHLHATEKVQEAVESFYATHFTSPPIGIHIRHSDLQSPLPRMLEKLQQVYTEGDGLFLCTDNQLVEKMVRRIYPHCVIRVKTFQGINVPLHNYVPGISNVVKGFDAVVEMLLLAKCQHIIHYAPSSFARIAILYAQLATGHVHAVP